MSSRPETYLLLRSEDGRRAASVPWSAWSAASDAAGFCPLTLEEFERAFAIAVVKRAASADSGGC